MTKVLALDPGDVDSAYSLIDAATRRPLEVGKVPNGTLLELLMTLCIGDVGLDEQKEVVRGVDHIGIEMISSYGMPVGREVFETCVWIGRFQQIADVYAYDLPCELIVRREVKLHHCRSTKATDSNITRALVDRFTPGASNFGKGTKAEPGWFYGFSKDMWQAHALAVLVADRLDGYQP